MIGFIGIVIYLTQNFKWAADIYSGYDLQLKSNIYVWRDWIETPIYRQFVKQDLNSRRGLNCLKEELYIAWSQRLKHHYAKRQKVYICSLVSKTQALIRRIAAYIDSTWSLRFKCEHLVNFSSVKYEKNDYWPLVWSLPWAEKTPNISIHTTHTCRSNPFQRARWDIRFLNKSQWF